MLLLKYLRNVQVLSPHQKREVPKSNYYGFEEKIHSNDHVCNVIRCNHVNYNYKPFTLLWNIRRKQNKTRVLTFEISIYGVKRLSCGCITHSDRDDVDSDREPTVYFGNKAYSLGQPLEST